jgi:aspartate aminotransferase
MAFYPNTITTTGLSKWCGAGGWRLGVALLGNEVSPELRRSMIGIASETYSSSSAPIQSAAKVAYADFAKRKPYLTYQTTILKAVASYCYDELTATNLMLYPAEGGFYLFLDFTNYKENFTLSGIQNSNDLCERLHQETGVALLPGTAFRMTNNALVTRMAFVDFDEPHEGSSFSLDIHAVKIKAGIEALQQWLHIHSL